MIVILLQNLNPSKTELARPYDSTVGVGTGFYWFGLALLLFIAGGVFKAFLDDKKWRGNFYKLDRTRKKFS